MQRISSHTSPNWRMNRKISFRLVSKRSFPPWVLLHFLPLPSFQPSFSRPVADTVGLSVAPRIETRGRDVQQLNGAVERRKGRGQPRCRRRLNAPTATPACVEADTCRGGYLPEVAHGLTVVDVARRYRVGTSKVRAWIRNGELKAINTATQLCARPRFVVPVDALAAFELSRTGAESAKPQRRRRQPAQIDFFPD